MKNGSQQNVKAPTTIPSVRVAFTFPIRSRDVVTETRRRSWLKIVDLKALFFALVHFVFQQSNSYIGSCSFLKWTFLSI